MPEVRALTSLCRYRVTSRSSRISGGAIQASGGCPDDRLRDLSSLALLVPRGT